MLEPVDPNLLNILIHSDFIPIRIFLAKFSEILLAYKLF